MDDIWAAGGSLSADGDVLVCLASSRSEDTASSVCLACDAGELLASGGARAAAVLTIDEDELLDVL